MVMSNTVLEMKRKRLERYYDAEEKVLNSQSYTLGSKTLTRADLASIQSMIKILESEIESLEKYGTMKRRSVRIVPVD